MQNNDGDRAIARHDRTAAAPALALFVLHAKHRIAGMEHEIISAIVGSLSLSLSFCLSIFAERRENPGSSRFFSLLAQTMEIVNISTRNEARIVPEIVQKSIGNCFKNIGGIYCFYKFAIIRKRPKGRRGDFARALIYHARLRS